MIRSRYDLGCHRLRSNTKNLGLENAHVELGEHGAIKVDEYSRTTQENIFAVGDCTSRVQLSPVAKAEGIAFANTVFGNKAQKLDYDYVPSAVFCRPEAAGVGMTEAKARKNSVNLYNVITPNSNHFVSANRTE